MARAAGIIFGEIIISGGGNVLGGGRRLAVECENDCLELMAILRLVLIDSMIFENCTY